MTFEFGRIIFPFVKNFLSVFLMSGGGSEGGREMRVGERGEGKERERDERERKGVG